MWHEVLTQTGKTLWRELGEEALKKAVSTAVGEGIKAVIDVWKARKIAENAAGPRGATGPGTPSASPPPPADPGPTA